MNQMGAACVHNKPHQDQACVAAQTVMIRTHNAKQHKTVGCGLLISSWAGSSSSRASHTSPKSGLCSSKHSDNLKLLTQSNMNPMDAACVHNKPHQSQACIAAQTLMI
jgi:hypothetical protein